jgi:zinc protease
MKTKKFFAVLLLTVVGTVTMVAQMQMPQIPVDPDVRIGKLDNGLTYYIRHNNWPENRAEFYIAQKVGSIQEDDNQRGLAHFLEHMAFNGSKHFKGNDLLRWCESIGVKFGTDLNAYTSIDQTVYNISNVPTTRESIVDSCLMILWDWADGLLLEQEEIEKERGVIHEEWRLRTSAQMRMIERDLPKLYPGSKYGYRMPIGLMEIIDNFERPFLQAYYEKWYRPDNQGIIVVGDVDVDKVEQKIKTMFSQIAKPGPDAAKLEAVDVPDNAEPIVVIDKDKEQRIDMVEVMFKHEAIPDSVKGSLEYLVANYLKNVALGMLNSRLNELGEKPDCPYLQAGVGDGTYLLSKPKDAFDLSIVPKEGQMNAAVKAVITEARRAAEFGFTATEYGRSKANTLSSLDKQYSNKDKRYNSQFVNQYVQHFLSNEPIPSIDDYYQLMKQ